MKQYLNLIEDILTNGIDRPDRTDVGGSRATFGKTLKVDLNRSFPALTVRKVAPRIAFEETMFFLRGDSDTKKLEEKNIKIWKNNTTREFLDKRGLNHLPEGDMGRGYGRQWRDFNGVDQIEWLLNNLKNNPNDRRQLVTAWNPAELDQMALPPCHLLQQYQVLDGKLNSLFFMRSVDFLYGAPYNLMGYAFLNKIFAKYLGLEPGTMTWMGGDVHIYWNQLGMAEQLISDPDRKPKQLPDIEIHKDLNTLDDIMSLEYKDIEVIGYDPHPDFKDKPAMAV